MGTCRRGRGSRGKYGIGEGGRGLRYAARVDGDKIAVEAHVEMIPGNGGEGQFDVTEENDGRVARIGGALVLVGDVGEEDVGRHLVVSGVKTA